MSLTYEEVRDKAMALTAEERGQLADELYDSVLSDEDLQFDDEYAAELKRRIAEIDAGTAETIDSDEAIESARKALVEARQNRRK